MKRAGAALAPQQRAVIYARRSTDHQEGSIDVQTAEAQKYIDAMGWKLQEVYVDDAISRAEYKKRPSLYGMLNGAERGDFDVIVMRDVDRLGGDTNRNGVILSDLIDKGVRVDEYLTKNTVKLDNAIAKFLAMAKNFAAEIEREKTSQRTHEALQVKATKGYNVGGKCFGYDNRKVYEGEKHVRTEYVKNEEQAAVVREIFEMFVKGRPSFCKKATEAVCFSSCGLKPRGGGYAARISSNSESVGLGRSSRSRWRRTASFFTPWMTRESVHL
jgi:DNA invertase Pin-like site-specific DNA recombinase